jgi:outer membrane lipoprotein-sorting protein
MTISPVGQPGCHETCPRRRRHGLRQPLATPLLAAALLLAPAVAPAGAQTVADLVAKNLAARGGAERLRAVDALKITGRMQSMGLELPLTIWRKRPNLVRQEMHLQDRAIVQAFDGERAWAVNPLAGSEAPQEIRGEPAEMMREQSDFDGPLVDYQQKGSTIEVEGPDTVEGTRTVMLKITLKSGRVQRLWLDADTGLEVKSASEVSQGSRTVKVETLLSDYRPEDGLVMPHRLRTFVDGQLQADVTIDRIEVSPRIDPAIFRMPSGVPDRPDPPRARRESEGEAGRARPDQCVTVSLASLATATRAGRRSSSPTA